MPYIRSALASVTRRYPFFSGCGTLANHPLMKKILPYSPEDAWAPTKGGYARVSLNDWLGRSVFLFGDLDPKLTWVLSRLIKPGDHVLDIGANIGLVTLLMSKLVGKDGLVHSFEPNPQAATLLRSALAYNRIENVKLHPIALGDVDQTLTLSVPTDNAGSASLVFKRPTDLRHQVQVLRLDDLVHRDSMAAFSLIKIDVEGFDLEVLKGGQTSIRAFRPIVLFEANDQRYSGQIPPIMSFLSELDYEFLAIPHCLFRMRTSTVDLSRPETMSSHDFLSVPRERLSFVARLLRCSR